jgi:hypothetical protein
VCEVAPGSHSAIAELKRSEKTQADLAESLDTRRETLGRGVSPADLARRRKAEADIAEATAKLAQIKINVASGKWTSREGFERQCARELSQFISDQEHFGIGRSCTRRYPSTW